jgi:hypothetical protein
MQIAREAFHLFNNAAFVLSLAIRSSILVEAALFEMQSRLTIERQKDHIRHFFTSLSCSSPVESR